MSCKGKTLETRKGSIEAHVDLNNQYDVIIRKFKPIMEGEWVKRIYIDDIQMTKSPYTSFSKLSNVDAFGVYFKDMKEDSITVGYSLNNHEGSEFSLVLKPGVKENSLKANLPDYDVKSNFYELGYTIRKNDTSLVLYHLNKNKNLIDSVQYSRVSRAPIGDGTATDDGIDYIVNKKLFTGKYKAEKANGDTFYIEFDNEGNVYNFSSFKKYSINTDFEAGPANNVNQIYFDLYTKSQVAFGYRFIADTLNLYNVKANADSTLLSFGDVKYKFIKQK